MPHSPLFATPVPGAGSAALRRRLEEMPGSGTVIHAGAQAIYVRFGDRVVGVAARGAVHVPAAIATALAQLPEVAVGAPAQICGGVLYVAGLAVSVHRLVATSAPRIHDPATAATRLAETIPDLGVVLDQLPEHALVRLAVGDAAAVAELLGRGDGLTPVGDDVVSGWLVATRSIGGDTSAVAAAVAELPHRTTTLSATLLADAADGESIPEFRTVLLALASGREVEDAITRLAAVGHTSGAGMLLGAHLALSRARSRVLTHNPEGSPR